jgi:CRP-like cAMP-binding protein
MATTSEPKRTGNRLLDRLPEDEYNRLLPSWESVPLPNGRELFKQNGPMSHVYFPTSGVCSVVNVTDDGAIVEAETVGNEGMIGIPVVLGLDFSPIRAIAQVSGEGVRIGYVPSLVEGRVAPPRMDSNMLSYVFAFSIRLQRFVE